MALLFTVSPTIRRYGRVFAIFLALASLMAWQAQAATFNWPDSRRHPRVIATSDQQILEYFDTHPDWFADDFLLLSFSISNVAYGNSEQGAADYQAVHERLLFSPMAMGDYISGTTAVSEELVSQYPPEAVAVQDMSIKMLYLGNWPRAPQQRMVDLSDANSENWLTRAIVDRWRMVSTRVRYIDNAAVHSGIMRLQSWDKYCDHIAHLREAAAQVRSRAIFAVYARIWELSEDDIRQLITAVGRENAVAMPLAWSRDIKKDRTANGWAMYRYRQMLDEGLALILIPSAEASEDELYTWISTWRQPTDRIYVAGYYWTAPPGPLTQ